MAEKSHPVAYKVALLKYLIDTKAWFRESNIERFWAFIGDTFTQKAAPDGSPRLTGKQLENLFRNEFALWQAESANNEKKRRVGHEKHSEYDSLMGHWFEIWDTMMIDYWKTVVGGPGPNFRCFGMVPDLWRAAVEKVVKDSASIEPPSNPNVQTTLTTDAAEKLRREIENAKQHAKTKGRPFIAEAIQELHNDSHNDPMLQQLMAKCMASQASKEESALFQTYIKSAKRRLKAAAKEQRHMTPWRSSLQIKAEQELEKAKHEPAAVTPTNNVQPAAVIQTSNELEKAKHVPAAVTPTCNVQPAAVIQTSNELEKAKQVPAAVIPTNSLPPVATVNTSIEPAKSYLATRNIPIVQPAPKEPATATATVKRKIAKPKNPPTRPVVRFPNMKPASNPRENTVEHRVDSAQASEQRSDKEADMNGKAAASVERGSSKSEGRERNSENSSGEGLDDALEADLIEAERAAKRRKCADSDDDSGNYQPTNLRKQAARNPTGRKLRQSERISAATSSLSSQGETEVEVASEAYVDELVSRRSAEASRQAIEAEYGPVSPTIAGDARSEAAEDWDSMPSPELDEKSRAEQQASTGAENGAARASSEHESELTKVPSPPPAPEHTTSGSESEALTPEDSSHAYRIITGAAAEAVAPAISRLEEKIDSLITSQRSQTQQPTPPPQQLTFSSAGQQAAEPLVSSTQELINLANALKSNDLLGKLGPETTPLIAQLIKNAAEAAIHAADAARKAGEIARDVSAVLMQLGAQEAATTPTQSDQ